jgi:DNA-binding XRE family transcriptional regulator
MCSSRYYPKGLAREVYKTPSCVKDLESLAAVIRKVRMSKRRKRGNPKGRPFHVRLNEARTAYGHSQIDAADAIGIDQKAYSEYDQDIRRARRCRLKF